MSLSLPPRDYLDLIAGYLLVRARSSDPRISAIANRVIVMAIGLGVAKDMDGLIAGLRHGDGVTALVIIGWGTDPEHRAEWDQLLPGIEPQEAFATIGAAMQHSSNGAWIIPDNAPVPEPYQRTRFFRPMRLGTGRIILFHYDVFRWKDSVHPGESSLRHLSPSEWSDYTRHLNQRLDAERAQAGSRVCQGWPPNAPHQVCA